jgi:hypothetical protein
MKLVKWHVQARVRCVMKLKCRALPHWHIDLESDL